MIRFTITWRESGELHSCDKMSHSLPIPDDILQCENTPLLKVLWRYLPEWDYAPILYCEIVSPEWLTQQIAELKRGGQI